MSKSQLDKRQFYNQSAVAQTYDEQRFGGASGAWVNTREIDLALSLLPPVSPVLDLACGTGRLTRALAQRGCVVGLDTSSAMLDVARQSSRAAFTQGDAFRLPFADATFQGLAALRLVFHFRQLDTLLREMRRVVAPGSVIVFDTYLWSPRALIPLDPKRWGSGVFVHSPQMVEDCARACGMRVTDHKTCFLFSPYLYRRLPMPAVRLLAQLEPRLPQSWHARVFWQIQR